MKPELGNQASVETPECKLSQRHASKHVHLCTQNIYEIYFFCAHRVWSLEEPSANCRGVLKGLKTREPVRHKIMWRRAHGTWYREGGKEVTHHSQVGKGTSGTGLPI